jgi:hypothetical protein
MRFVLPALAALAGAGAAAVWAGQVSAPVTATVISADGTTLHPSAAAPNAVTPRAATGIYTSEGMWTFGTPPNAGGDYPLLLNGSNANGGFADMLQVTNGNLYAMQKNGAYWVRWAPTAAWLSAGKPAEGTAGVKTVITPASAKSPDNSPAGTVVAKVTVTMSPASAQFTGPLVSSNPFYRFQGSDIVLSRALTAADKGTTHDTMITAVQ